jgi:hypothetical protein
VSREPAGNTGPDQAESRSRPLRRRPARMARPARVRIRSRKPCVRARRRLFGWKVRLPLLTVDSPGRRRGSVPAAGLLKVPGTVVQSRDTARGGRSHWSAVVLGGREDRRDRRRTRFTPAYAAAREPVKPPSDVRPARLATQCLVARQSRIPAAAVRAVRVSCDHRHTSVSVLPREIVPGGSTRPHGSAGPRNAGPRAAAYGFAHRCGQVWG